MAICSSEINSLFHPEAWTFDTAATLAIFQVDGRSFLGRLGRRYRRAVAGLRTICRNKVPRNLVDRVGLVQKLQNAQKARNDFSAVSSYLSDALGPIWQDEDGRWREARALIEWVRIALSGIGAKQIIALAARSSELTTFGAYADNLEQVAKTASEECACVFQVVAPEPLAVFDSDDYRQVQLSDLVQILSNWRIALPAVNDWVKVREALIDLSAKGFAEIAGDMATGELQPRDARPIAGSSGGRGAVGTS